MDYLIKLAIVFASLNIGPTISSNHVDIKIIEGEYWWAGLSSIGHEAPYNEKSIVSIDQWGNNFGNQAQPPSSPTKEDLSGVKNHLSFNSSLDISLYQLKEVLSKRVKKEILLGLLINMQ